MRDMPIITKFSTVRSAYEAGVTYAVASLAPYSGLIGGLSTTIRTGAHHALEKGAVIQEVTALHVTIERNPWGFGYFSISTQINVLRKLLLGSHEGVARDSATGRWFGKVTNVSRLPGYQYRLRVTPGYCFSSRVRYPLS